VSDYVLSREDGLRARAGGVWTQEKLAYLRKYAEAFMIAMAPKRDAGKWEQLVFIDPLCGPGVDVERRSSKEFQGSPSIALMTVPAFDRLFFGDLDEANVYALAARIPPKDISRVSLTAIDCHHRVDEVVKSLSRRTLGLAFVDPEGFEVHFALFQTLAQRAVDIVFLFPSGIGIVRNLASFVRSTHCGLDDLWGNGEWRKLPMAQMAAGDTPTDASPNDTYYRSWAAAFCERVATLGYTYYDIQGPLRGESRNPMYHLLFFSKSEAGQTIWRNVHQIDPRGQRQLRFDRAE
jgi:three-Cys-motif partner protein